MFFGSYLGQIDRQKRILIPSDFRKALFEREEPEKETIFLKRFGEGIEIYPVWEMASIYGELQEKSIIESTARDEMIEIAKDFYGIKVDLATGRFKIPEDLFGLLQLGQKVVFQGGGRFIRVIGVLKD